MSLLADLLSKIKHKEQRGVVPPNLAQVVQRASDARRVETKIKVILLVALLLVACGLGTIYFINGYLKPGSPAEVGQRVQAPKDIERNQAPAVENIAPQAKTEMKAAPLPSPSAQPAAKIEAGPETKSEAKSEVKPPKTFPPFDMTKDQQQKESSSGAPVNMTKKAVPPEKSKKTSGFSENSKNERDVALYTAKADEQSRNYSQAISNYKRALEKDPKNYLIMNSLANVLIKTGSYKESLKYSMDALSIRKDYVPSLINLGIANIQLGNTTEGEMYLVKAKSLEPSNKTVLFNLGLLYEKLTNFQEALNAFQRLADMKATEGFVGMARVFEKQGKKPEAEKIYRDILWMDNVDPTTKQFASERLIAMGNR